MPLFHAMSLPCIYRFFRSHGLYFCFYTTIFSIFLSSILFHNHAALSLKRNLSYSPSPFGGLATRMMDADAENAATLLSSSISPRLLNLFALLSFPYSKDFSKKDLLPYYKKSLLQIEYNTRGIFYENVTENKFHFQKWVSKNSCRSRHERFQHQRKAITLPSPNFYALMYRYAEFHRNCTSAISLYGQTLTASHRKSTVTEWLHAASNDSLTELVSDWKNEYYLSSNRSGCKYLVMETKETHGIGNRLLSLISQLLYAVLSRRVLLIPHDPFADILCEPFHNSSWIIPLRFSGHIMNQFVNLNEFVSDKPNAQYVRSRYGNLFPCVKTQIKLRKVKWLLINSNVYFIPELFNIVPYRKLLEQIFPDRNIFNHLSREFLLPNDKTWERIMIIKRGYMHDNADRYVGMHIRMVHDKSEYHIKYLHYINQRLMDCSLNISKILPLPKSSKNNQDVNNHNTGGPISINVFIASVFADLHSQFFKNLYMDGGMNGESLSFNYITSSHNQSMDTEEHRQSLTEIWLLSFCDYLITSASSTFSYIAQGLGDHKPWSLAILPYLTHHAACVKRISSEPCHLNVVQNKCPLTNRATQGITSMYNYPYLHRCFEIYSSLILLNSTQFYEFDHP